MKIVNLTQHPASKDQREVGVFDLQETEIAVLKGALTFFKAPNWAELKRRAKALAALANHSGAKAAMIGGAPYLMGHLETQLRLRNIKPLYAFSRRESKEVTLADGSVRKTNIFHHLGWVTAEPPAPPTKPL